MSKAEMRKERRGGYSAAGAAEKDLAQLKRMKRSGSMENNEIVTITVGCSTLFSIICC